MNNIAKFYKYGSLTLNVDYEAKPGSPIICVNDGLWYKFKIDKVEELEDHTFNITTTTLISIDENLCTK